MVTCSVNEACGLHPICFDSQLNNDANVMDDPRYKMSWFEGSARVPLLISYPQRYSSKIVPQNVSSLDLLPTLVDLVGGSIDSRLSLDGTSLLPYLESSDGLDVTNDTVYGEYAGEGTIAPLMMIRRGPWKFVTCPVDPPQLFNLKTDPKELQNLAKSQIPAIQDVFASFAKEANERWDFKSIHQEVLRSQRARRLCWDALTRGRYESWDYQPKEEARDKYAPFSVSPWNVFIHTIDMYATDTFAPTSLWMNSSFAHATRPWTNSGMSCREARQRVSLGLTTSRMRKL